MSKYGPRYHERTRKNPFASFGKMVPNLRATKWLAIFLVVVSGTSYVVLGNISTARAYHLRELEGKLTDLRRENRRLELEVVKATSAEAVTSEVQSLGMVSASGVAYVESGGTQVAKK